MRQGWAVVGLAALIAAPVAASGPAQKLVQTLSACRSVTDTSARLTCYDTASTALEAAIAAKEVVLVDREQVKRDRRKQFGFIELQPGEVDAGVPEPAELGGKVTSLALAGEFLVIAVENSGTWKTTEGGLAVPVLGEQVTIKKGALGSYVLVFRGGALRVRRLR